MWACPTRRSPRSSALAALKTLLPFLRPYRGVAAAAITALLVASAAMLALPVALRRVIDVLAARDAGTTNRIFAGFLAAAAIFAVFAALRFYLVTWLGERVVADLRSAVYSRVVRLDPLFFETTRVGAVLSRLTRTQPWSKPSPGQLSIILRSTLSLVGSLVLLTLTSAKLAGLILGLMPIVVVPLIIIGRRVRGLSARRRIVSPTRAASPAKP